MKKVFLAGGVILLLLALVIATRSMRKPEEENVALYTVIETALPKIDTIELYTSLIGTVEPEQVARIYSEIAGTVLDVYVKPGETVAEGQLICTINNKQVETAENTVENTQITYEEAMTVLKRMQILYEVGDISYQDYEGHINSAKRAEIAYRQAKEDYERQLSYSNITSPISGKVEKVDIDILDHVSSGDELCVISGKGNQIISASLTENIRNAVTIGDYIYAEKNGDQYIGTISEISEMTDEKTGLYKVKIQMEKAENLTTGSVIKLSVCSNRADAVLTVPVDSVYYEGGRPYLFTFEAGTIHKIFIKSGIYDSEKIEVKEGIDSATEIVTTWSPELYEGAQAVKSEETAPSLETSPERGGDAA